MKIRSALTKNLNQERPDKPEHPEADTVAAYRQWFSDCRAVAEALNLKGDDEEAFLRECGLGPKERRPGDRLSWREVNSNLETLRSRITRLQQSVPLDAPDIFTQALSVMWLSLNRLANQADQLSGRRAQKKAPRAPKRKAAR